MTCGCWGPKKRLQDDPSGQEEAADMADLKMPHRPPFKSRARQVIVGIEEFRFEELVEATQGWDPSMVIGEGGYGKVYRGRLKSDTLKQMVAIKRCGQESDQGEEEFLAEIAAMSKVRHKNLVQLIGFSEAGNERCLLYEYMANGTVQDHLLGRASAYPCRKVLFTWPKRVNIALEAARGLEYLHSAVEPPIIHRDVKLSNILLDADLHAKVADFGISQLKDATGGDNSVRGTFGFIDPYYVANNVLTPASDVYSFGVCLLELVTGRQAVSVRRRGEPRHLLHWAVPLITANRSADIVDPRLDGAYYPPGVDSFCALALACIRAKPRERPTMSEVVRALEAVETQPLRHPTAKSPGRYVGPVFRESGWENVSPTCGTSPTGTWPDGSDSNSGMGSPFPRGGFTAKRGHTLPSFVNPKPLEAVWSGPMSFSSVQPR